MPGTQQGRRACAGSSPKTQGRIDDLRQHACLSLRRSDRSIAPWTFLDGNKAVEAIVSGPLIAHDYPTLLGAAIEGMGLAQVPGPLAKAPIADGRLQALLMPFAVTTSGVFLYYPGKRQVLPKLRAFIEHVKHRNAVAPREGKRVRNHLAAARKTESSERPIAADERGEDESANAPHILVFLSLLHQLQSGIGPRPKDL
jgi:hypothetical protein